ncbi:tRNA pseudouridine(13) synthase TruD [Methanopyrus sp.]
MSGGGETIEETQKLTTLRDVEEYVGIREHMIDRGVGGSCRRKVEDFLVMEKPSRNTYIPITTVGECPECHEYHRGMECPECGQDLRRPRVRPQFGGRGPHTLFYLEKYDWDTMKAVRRIARALKKHHRHFGIAGMKDKQAVTSQRVTVRGVPPAVLARLRIRDLKVIPMGRARRKLRPGDLWGNRFVITVRGAKIRRLSEALETVRKLGGVPNYYGLQRFGSRRPVTHVVGKYVVLNDWEKAVKTFLTLEYPRESPEALEARRWLKEHWGEFKEALRRFPKFLDYERHILEHLARHPHDYINAFRRLPMWIRRMFVHAYQSYLFNRILSERIAQGLPVHRPVEGDVTQDGLPTIPLPGFRTEFSDGPQGEIEREVLEEEGVRLEDFEIKSMPELSAGGDRKPALLRVYGLHAEAIGDDTVRFTFSLPRGGYATTVLRELLGPEGVYAD